MRRWISAARFDSISCSVTAQAKASQGFGQRPTRYQGILPDQRAQERVPREAREEGPQVVVDGERVAGPVDRDLEILAGRDLALGGAQPGGRGGQRRDRHLSRGRPQARVRTGRAGDPQEALVDALTAAGDPVGIAASERQAVAAGRPHLDDQRPRRDRGRRGPSPASAAEQVNVDQERATGDHVAIAPAAPQSAAGCGSPTSPWRR